ncbi:MAG: carbamate kinase [Candidatus Dadabacteria bacterium]|nr:MAG: carbamate kinase [Candidatus Dadabacteria bacterium]
MKAAVVAFGGNALMDHKGKSTYVEQIMKTDKMCRKLIGLFDMGYRVVVTHGNGPQVGNFLMQQECLSASIPPMPLDVCNAMTQGQIGYMIEQRLRNLFLEKKMSYPTVAFVTQVVVSEDDPAFKNPTKPIGGFMTEEEARKFEAQGWQVMEDSGRGWRRVVASPIPRSVIEINAIQALMLSGYVTIACGGGGIPVVRQADGSLRGVYAVIDKDRASALLALTLRADLLMISTGVEKVAINFNKPNQQFLDRLTLKQARQYMAEGHFGIGSMQPKIEAAIDFVQNGGPKAIITGPDYLVPALRGETGTWVVPE